MAFASSPVPQTTPLLLGDEMIEITNQSNNLKLLIEASAALQRYCNRRFDEYRDIRYFAARRLRDDGDLTDWTTLQVNDDLKQVLTLAKDVPATATDISEGTAVAAGQYLTPGRRSMRDPIGQIMLVSGTFGGLGLPDDWRSIWIDGLWGWGGQWVDTGLTVSDNPQTSGSTTLTPSSITGFEVGHVLKLDSEYTYVRTVNASTLTISRGYNGSTAAQHIASTKIYYWQADDQVRALVRRLVMWAVEQIKSPVAGAVTLGDFNYPVDMSGLPKDVYTAINDSALERLRNGIGGL